MLEGPELAVRETLSIIRADPRHDSLRVLHEESAGGRAFKEWSMGFRNLSGRPPEETQRLSHFLERPLEAGSSVNVEGGQWSCC